MKTSKINQNIITSENKKLNEKEKSNVNLKFKNIKKSKSFNERSNQIVLAKNHNSKDSPIFSRNNQKYFQSNNKIHSINKFLLTDKGNNIKSINQKKK